MHLFYVLSTFSYIMYSIAFVLTAQVGDVRKKKRLSKQDVSHIV